MFTGVARPVFAGCRAEPFCADAAGTFPYSRQTVAHATTRARFMLLSSARGYSRSHPTSASKAADMPIRTPRRLPLLGAAERVNPAGYRRVPVPLRHSGRSHPASSRPASRHKEPRRALASIGIDTRNIRGQGASLAARTESNVRIRRSTLPTSAAAAPCTGCCRWCSTSCRRY